MTKSQSNTHEELCLRIIVWTHYLHTLCTIAFLSHHTETKSHSFKCLRQSGSLNSAFILAIVTAHTVQRNPIKLVIKSAKYMNYSQFRGLPPAKPVI